MGTTSEFRTGNTRFAVLKKGEQNEMNRKEYLNRCMQATQYTVSGKVVNPPDNVLVYVDNLKYFPKALELKFDKFGEVVQNAILIDINRNSQLTVSLERVEER